MYFVAQKECRWGQRYSTVLRQTIRQRQTKTKLKKKSIFFSAPQIPSFSHLSLFLIIHIYLTYIQDQDLITCNILLLFFNVTIHWNIPAMVS